jgi:hypothetical protein
MYIKVFILNKKFEAYEKYGRQVLVITETIINISVYGLMHDIIVCFLKPFLEQGHENSNRQQILKNKQAFKLGSSIAKLITSSWNSQEKLEKVYIFNRKVHHSGVGALLGLRSLFSKSQPIPSEILSGLGKL